MPTAIPYTASYVLDRKAPAQAGAHRDISNAMQNFHNTLGKCLSLLMFFGDAVSNQP